MLRVMYLVLLLLSHEVAHAQERDGRVGLGIGDDGNVKLFIHVGESFSIKYSYYTSTIDRKETTSNDYTRDIDIHVFGLRNYFNNTESYSWFLDFDYVNQDVVYNGNTQNQDNNTDAYGLYTGLEYWFNEKISVDARLGIETFKTDLETYKEEGTYYPTTDLSLNYLF